MKNNKFVTILMSLMIVTIVFLAQKTEAYAAGISDEAAVRAIFDATYYAEHNPDVVSARGASAGALMQHYMECGMREGRSASASFNVKAYRSRYPDLSAAYGDDWISYVRHYVSFGNAEGRDASPAPNVSYTQGAEWNLLGSYTTKYKDNIPRAVNVGIASSAINGVVVQPGAQFSFTGTIPPRTVENGYQVAMIFINKEKSEGLGGGICQVSSTLYACMKTIGLPATERHPHSLPVTYVPEGWDATVSGQTLDLKFVNTYSTPLMITSVANGGKLTVSLYLKSTK